MSEPEERLEAHADERRPAFHDIRDDFDDEFGRSRTPREVARRMVLGPAIAFVVIGILGILGMCVAEGFLVYENLERALNGKTYALQSLIFGTLGIFLALVLFSITIAGGIAMMNLRRRWLALFAAYIVAGLSLAGCYAVLFFPFGIWGLILLYRPDVRREFPRKKRTQEMLDFDEPRQLPERE